jgi:hypothetical protein
MLRISASRFSDFAASGWRRAKLSRRWVRLAAFSMPS